LLGVILRGAFFAFRHIAQAPGIERLSSLVFGASSIMTPFFFAATLGAASSGRVGVGGPKTGVWEACLSPMSISFGLVSVAATAFSGATFLVGDARRGSAPQLVDYFRKRALAATAALMALGSLGLVAIGLEAPRLLSAALTGPAIVFALGAMVLTPVVGFLLWRGTFAWYRLLAVGAVSSLVLAWGFALAPDMLPGELTVARAAAPAATQVVLLVVGALVVLLVIPALALLVYLQQRTALESGA
jgi:cytochrome d ubiquinol oxidase subunit II